MSSSTDSGQEHLRATVDSVYRSESRRVLATLIRLLGDFELAEEALHEAFRAAMEKWGRDGVPANPRAWLVSVGRFKAIDALRRRARFDEWSQEHEKFASQFAEVDVLDEAYIADDRLRLIFLCCHPEVPEEAQIATTLREVCDLTTEEIAHAFLSRSATIAQRIVRAKQRMRESKLPFELPAPAELPKRLESVLRVIYLVYNEGYSASTGSLLLRSDLSREAIRLGRLLVELLPDTEAKGLLALLLLSESRREARCNRDGDIIVLEEQDRSLWNRDLIAEAHSLLAASFSGRRVGPYTLQAAIAAVHAEAADAASTNWTQIVALYDLLLKLEPSPVVELNRAVAIAMRDSPQVALPLVDELLGRGVLAEYHLAHAVRADLCRRMGQGAEARASYEKALQLVRQEPERRFLTRRIQELDTNL